MSLLRVATPVALFLCLAFASPAGAASLAFTGTLSLEVATAPAIVVSGTGVATVNGAGHLHSLAVPASAFVTTNRITPYTDPALFPLVGQIVTVTNDPGSFADGGGTLGGAMPLRGLVRLCVQYDCAAPALNVSIPLSVVGQAGQSKSVSFLVNLTVEGAPWTSGVAVGNGGATAQGFAHGAASGTSSTAGPSGVVSLVTPIFVSTGIAASATIPTFARLTLQFVPEPAPAVLLLMGCAALAVAGRRLRTRLE